MKGRAEKLSKLVIARIQSEDERITVFSDSGAKVGKRESESCIIGVKGKLREKEILLKPIGFISLLLIFSYINQRISA